MRSQLFASFLLCKAVNAAGVGIIRLIELDIKPTVADDPNPPSLKTMRLALQVMEGDDQKYLLLSGMDTLFGIVEGRLSENSDNVLVLLANTLAQIRSGKPRRARVFKKPAWRLNSPAKYSDEDAASPNFTKYGDKDSDDSFSPLLQHEFLDFFEDGKEVVDKRDTLDQNEPLIDLKLSLGIPGWRTSSSHSKLRPGPSKQYKSDDPTSISHSPDIYMYDSGSEHKVDSSRTSSISKSNARRSKLRILSNNDTVRYNLRKRSSENGEGSHDMHEFKERLKNHNQMKLELSTPKLHSKVLEFSYTYITDEKLLLNFRKPEIIGFFGLGSKIKHPSQISKLAKAEMLDSFSHVTLMFDKLGPLLYFKETAIHQQETFRDVVESNEGSPELIKLDVQVRLYEFAEKRLFEAPITVNVMSPLIGIPQKAYDHFLRSLTDIDSHGMHSCTELQKLPKMSLKMELHKRRSYLLTPDIFIKHFENGRCFLLLYHTTDASISLGYTFFKKYPLVIRYRKGRVSQIKFVRDEQASQIKIVRDENDDELLYPKKKQKIRSINSIEHL